MQFPPETNFITTLSDIIIIGICMLNDFSFYQYTNELEIPDEKLYCQVFFKIPRTSCA